MAAQVQFCVVQTEAGARVGQLTIPHRKSADWINFLVSPRQQVQIVCAETRRSSLVLYFNGNDRLYSYLSDRLGGQANPTSELESSRLAAIAN